MLSLASGTRSDHCPGVNGGQADAPECIRVTAADAGRPQVQVVVRLVAHVLGVTGYLVPSATPALLAARISQLLAHPMLREGFGIAAASRAQARYSWERVSQETLAVYEALPPGRLPVAA